jgi:cell division septation protein DedD
MAYQKRSRKKKEKKEQSIASMMLILLFISAVAFGLGYLTGDKPEDQQKDSVDTPKKVLKKPDNVVGVPIEEIDPKNVVSAEERESSVIDTLEKDRPPVTAPLPVGKPAPLPVPKEEQRVDLKSETELTPGIKLKSPTKAETKKRPDHKKKKTSAKHKGTKKKGSNTEALFTVQVAAFSSKNEARKMNIKLSSKGYQSYIRPFTKDGKNWYRVRIGRGISNAEAKRISAKIKSTLHLSPIVTKHF